MKNHWLMICPCIDRSTPDRAQTFKEIGQISGIWFKVKGVQAENQHNYIILWPVSIGLRMINTWGLRDEQLKDPNNIWEKISEQIEPPENFCIHRMEFQRFRQRDDGSVDDFYTRCKSKATKCKFQNGLNKKNRGLDIGRQIRRGPERTTWKRWQVETHLLTPTKQRHPTWQSIDNKGSVNTIGQQQRFKQCGNCGGRHAFTPRWNCPAYKDKCNNCGRTGHW